MLQPPRPCFIPWIQRAPQTSSWRGSSPLNLSIKKGSSIQTPYTRPTTGPEFIRAKRPSSVTEETEEETRHFMAKLQGIKKGSSMQTPYTRPTTGPEFIRAKRPSSVTEETEEETRHFMAKLQGIKKGSSMQTPYTRPTTGREFIRAKRPSSVTEETEEETRHFMAKLQGIKKGSSMQTPYTRPTTGPEKFQLGTQRASNSSSQQQSVGPQSIASSSSSAYSSEGSAQSKLSIHDDLTYGESAGPQGDGLAPRGATGSLLDSGTDKENHRKPDVWTGQKADKVKPFGKRVSTMLDDFKQVVSKQY